MAGWMVRHLDRFIETTLQTLKSSCCHDSDFQNTNPSKPDKLKQEQFGEIEHPFLKYRQATL